MIYFKKLAVFLRMLLVPLGTSKRYHSGFMEVGRFTYGARYIKLLRWDNSNKLYIGSFCSLSKKITIFLGGNHDLDCTSTFPFGVKFTLNNLCKARTAPPNQKVML